jgi:hypothetical protein
MHEFIAQEKEENKNGSIGYRFLIIPYYMYDWNYGGENGKLVTVGTEKWIPWKRKKNVHKSYFPPGNGTSFV